MMTYADARWENCIAHRGEEAESFLTKFFGEKRRSILLVGGAGFDPRALEVPRRLAAVAGERVTAIFLRERRPDPRKAFLERADRNVQCLLEAVRGAKVLDIQIFASDLAVIGGREAARLAGQIDFHPLTDVVVDASALSRGVVFPLVRVLLDRAPEACNLHLVVTDEPKTDEAIITVGCERATTVHGFKGTLGQESYANAAVLWLPQLVPGQTSVLGQIYNAIQPSPHDVCPILPFPAADQRAVDSLLVEYRVQLGAWEVDPRDVVYAHESDPLDLYRTILRMDSGRKRIFQETGSSQIVLSPVGSKVLSFGALMAAIERDFPVMYVEAVDYKIDEHSVGSQGGRGEIVHLWLKGEAYATN
jgi:hypothetical protein